MASSKIFSIEGKGLKLDTAADLEPHVTSLRDNANVEEVRLAGNTLGVEACSSLAKILGTKKTLQIANLADIFTSRLLTEIPPALNSLLTAFLALPNLHTINLNDNAFGLNTQAPLVEFLSKHVPLQHLILNNNGLGPHAGVMIANALSELSVRKDEARSKGLRVPNLETIICGRNRLESGSMEAWARAFSLHKGLREVKMVQNGIRQEGIALLIREGLKHCTELRILDLQDNTFTIIGSRVLAETVPTWKQIVELGVGDSLLSAKGANLVAQALKKGENEKLATLRLQYNDIDASALAEFSTAASTSLPSLKRIELNGNKFSEEDDAVEALRELLGKRKEKSGQNEDEEEWGLDSLSDLEDESDDDEDDEAAEEQEEEEEKEERAEHAVRDAEKAEEENVAQRKDDDVDALAERLGKTEI